MLAEYEEAHVFRAGYNPEFVERARRNNRRRAQEAKRRELATVEAQTSKTSGTLVELCPAPKHGDRLAHLDGPKFSSPRAIIERVSAWHDMEANVVTGPLRNIPIVAARTDAMAAIYINCRRWGSFEQAYVCLSLPAIGRHFNRDHTTVLHALKKAGVK